MKIWIRSQDRTKFLVCDNLRVDDVLIELSKTKFKKEIPSYMEIKSVIYAGSTLLGRYDTKERCLEIIDEIQSLLCDFILATNVEGADALNLKKYGVQGINYYNPHISSKIEYYERSSIVYEMPKE